MSVNDGPPLPFEPGSMIMSDTSMSMTMESTESVAGLYFGSTWNRFLGLGPTSGIVGRPFGVDQGFARVFSGLLNSTLSSGVGPQDKAMPPLFRAVDSVVESCVIAETGWAILDTTSRIRQLHDAASRYIALHFYDASLDVSAIARKLGVSKKHLQAAFRAAGDTPSVALRRARLARANALMSEQKDLTVRDLRRIAEASGFTGTLQLRRAIEAASRVEPQEG
ncbi:helix-turn-helix domain-containing protein [Pseudoclavibacter sp. VKM Ac-2867]|uniref:helix-turn-helix domain-containing protein n=1 Tax=Pseudoclavibacter sp. VKM Ac-2867 TaxID=2783829 RepID=UPI00188C8D58|nr:helix-turn-helix domain-containing protein [Pseudoclavibacter sp. VKM Ac-2867]MBF4460517.1 helix-turn-helix domain-containing protein [Pseudoclavibacter sp. VKM Ac-2867]